MGFFARTISRSGIPAQSWQEALAAFLRGDDDPPVPTAAGAPVTEQGALALTAVYACIRILSQTMAMLPLVTYERLPDDGRRKATDHRVYRLLHDAPNPQQTSFDWRSLTSVHQNMWGAGISEIEFDGNGEPVALWPIPPWRVTPTRLPSGEIVYVVKMPDGSDDRILPDYRTAVFRAMSTSSYQWMSPIAVEREAIGYGLALQDFGARTFGQGTNPAGTLSMDGHLNEKAEQSLLKQMKNYEGLGNAHRLMLLQDGLKFQRIGLPPEDAQYIESRGYNIADIARIWNVPLHLLQDHSKATTWGSGLEELQLSFLTHTIQPFLVQWEQELHRRLFLRDGDVYFPEFQVGGLMRGRINDRYNAYNIGRNGGWLSANDIRRLENLNPIPADDGGNEYIIQGAMVPLSQAGQNVDQGADPEENPPPEEDPEGA